MIKEGAGGGGRMRSRRRKRRKRKTDRMKSQTKRERDGKKKKERMGMQGRKKKEKEKEVEERFIQITCFLKSNRFFVLTTELDNRKTFIWISACTKEHQKVSNKADCFMLCD